MKCDKFVINSVYETVSDLKPADQKSLEASKQTNAKLQADKEPISPSIKSKSDTKETTNSEITNSSIPISKTGNQLRFLILFLILMEFNL